MKANEFVKKFGWEEAKIICNGVFTGVVCYKWVELNIDDLKRLVESHELVESYGGLESAKKFVGSEYRKLSQPKTYNHLCEAISDVESCK